MRAPKCSHISLEPPHQKKKKTKKTTEKETSVKFSKPSYTKGISGRQTC